MESLVNTSSKIIYIYPRSPLPDVNTKRASLESQLWFSAQRYTKYHTTVSWRDPALKNLKKIWTLDRISSARGLRQAVSSLEDTAGLQHHHHEMIPPRLDTETQEEEEITQSREREMVIPGLPDLLWAEQRLRVMDNNHRQDGLNNSFSYASPKSRVTQLWQISTYFKTCRYHKSTLITGIANGYSVVLYPL